MAQFDNWYCLSELAERRGRSVAATRNWIAGSAVLRAAVFFDEGTWWVPERAIVEHQAGCRKWGEFTGRSVPARPGARSAAGEPVRARSVGEVRRKGREACVEALAHE